MKIKNYNKTFTNNQLRQLIKLLPSKYRNLNIDVIFPMNKWHCLKWVYLKEYVYNIKGIFKKEFGGTSSVYYPKIFIYAFNYDTKYEYGDFEKLKIIETLYHEIRHQWQRYNNTIKFNKYNFNKDYKNKVKYEDSWQEIDANGFASWVMNTYYNQIIEILI